MGRDGVGNSGKHETARSASETWVDNETPRKGVSQEFAGTEEAQSQRTLASALNKSTDCVVLSSNCRRKAEADATEAYATHDSLL